METTLNILHHQTVDWLRELEFYVEELAILSGRLVEISDKWRSDKEVMRFSRHFQNRFISLREEVDALAKDIKFRETKIEKSAEKNPEEVDEQIRMADDKIFDRMAALAAGIGVSRYEFNRFLAKVM
jgi:hypothetical protein